MTDLDSRLADLFAIPRSGPRLQHALAYNKITTMDQLLRLSRQELLRLPNVGRISVDLLEEELAKQGVGDLGSVDDDPTELTKIREVLERIEHELCILREHLMERIK